MINITDRQCVPVRGWLSDPHRPEMFTESESQYSMFNVYPKRFFVNAHLDISTMRQFAARATPQLTHIRAAYHARVSHAMPTAPVVQYNKVKGFVECSSAMGLILRRRSDTHRLRRYVQHCCGRSSAHTPRMHTQTHTNTHRLSAKCCSACAPASSLSSSSSASHLKNLNVHKHSHTH